ncbi:serine/arginine repetitive matrix protein 2 [Galendromus occidentalis]|uniref:Serine/arginine repetitive matrix protein 2 n=1 Tax=Galendromus occidentalis TaxID=34638 RepID=A0AAJ7L6D7_9ACAR|nr:serine/arginine repetitive matrix protein 2 [Galendromus occidentalis]
MYNGIGLQSSRGSGTNGYVQRNLGFSNRVPQQVKYRSERDIEKLEGELKQGPSQEILDHYRRRKIELDLAEYEQELVDAGLSQDEIEHKVSRYRKKLVEDDDLQIKKQQQRNLASLKDSHEIAEANLMKNDRLRDALGISNDFVDGSSFDQNARRERNEKERAERELQKQKRLQTLVPMHEEEGAEVDRKDDKEISTSSKSKSKSKKRKSKSKKRKKKDAKKKDKKRKKRKSAKPSSSSSSSSSDSSSSSSSSSESSDSSDDDDSGSSSSSDSSSEEDKKKKKKKRKRKSKKRKEDKHAAKKRKISLKGESKSKPPKKRSPSKSKDAVDVEEDSSAKTQKHQSRMDRSAEKELREPQSHKARHDSSPDEESKRRREDKSLKPESRNRHPNLKAFERRLTEIVQFLQPPTTQWRVALAGVFICALFGAYKWVFDPETSRVSLSESLWIHWFFSLSVALLLILFACGVHRRVVMPQIIIQRARTDAQNAAYFQHPDEVLRTVPEPSAAAIARRALRGLSTSEVIKGVYPTLPKPQRKIIASRNEPGIEKLPAPESLRLLEPPSGDGLPVQNSGTPRTPLSSPIQNPSIIRAPPAVNIRIVPLSPPRQEPAPKQNTVDVNVFPKNFQSQKERTLATRIPPPAVNIGPAPDQARFAPEPRADSEPQQEPRRVEESRADDSDDYYESYEFGYEIRTPEGTHSHEERKIPTGQVFGSYSMALADGRQRLVTYSADGDGFHPIVETNELGTLTSEPADAKIISSATLSTAEPLAKKISPVRIPKGVRRVRKTKTKRTSN